MTVKQICVFLENKPGCLAELIDILSQNNIDMRAMSIAEMQDFGILRIIVKDTYNAVRIIKEAGFVTSVNEVLAVAIPDQPGALLQTLTALGEANINLDYSYAFTTAKKDMAYTVLRVTDNDKAAKVLGQKGIRMLGQEEMEQL